MGGTGRGNFHYVPDDGAYRVEVDNDVGAGTYLRVRVEIMGSPPGPPTIRIVRIFEGH